LARIRRCVAGLVLGASTCLPLSAAAESPLGLGYVETPDVRLIYFTPVLDYLVPHALGTFRKSLEAQKRHFGWVPSDRVGLVLNDFSDYGNASATPLPFNTLRIDIEPSSNAFETNPSSERLYSTMNHELVHIATTDIANSQDRAWRRFFLGKVGVQSQHPESLLYSYLTVPRFTVPRWYLEGSAVFMETWMDGGYGRAQGGYDEMVFRAMVRDDAWFYDPLGLASRGTRVDFQVGANAYLYGTRFFTWLALEHSPEKVLEWLRRDEGSRRHYADQFEHVFGMPLDKAWQDWIAFEKAFQRANLEQVRQHAVTPEKKLVASPLGSVSRAHFDESSGTLYAAVRYPGTVEHIAAIDTNTGAVRVLADLKGAALYSVTSIAFDPATRTIFFTTDNLSWRDVWALDVATGEQRLLLHDERIGELVFNRADRSLMGVRHQFGLATLVRIPHPYTEWNTVHTFPYGVVPTDLDVSRDGQWLSASISTPGGEQFVRVWPLAKVLAGDMTAKSEFRWGESAPEGFVFSPDGRHLFGSAYYTGVSNIFRYEVATGQVEAVSNAETGLFRPVPLSDGRLVVFSYSGAGFQPAIIEPTPLKDVSSIRFLGTEVTKRHPVVTTWKVPHPDDSDAKEGITARGDYHPLESLRLQNAFPVLQGYKDAVGGGVRVNFGDDLGYASLGIMAAYTPSDSIPNRESGHVIVRGHYLNWRGELSVNRSDFYDIFGPTKRSRKGYAAKFGNTQSLIFDTPRTLDLVSEVAFYDKIGALPNAQNIEAGFDSLVTAEVGLRYSNVRRSLGAVDDEKGAAGTAVLATSIFEGKTVPQLRGTFDFGIALPPHSSIWSRTAAGAARGDASDSAANFYFGAFGNNYVDDGNVKRYREYYAMPGFGINELAGQRFIKQMVEWNLPPYIFERAGRPDFFLQSLRPAAFVTGLWTDPFNSGSDSRRSYSNIGGQVDLKFSVLHWYEMTLSVGYAVGFRNSTRAGDEWMVSLKIL
jgi:hypothetical protein